MVPEQANKAFGAGSATAIDPLGIASILLFERKITVCIELHRGDIAGRDQAVVRDHLKIFRSRGTECQRPIERIVLVIVTANSCDVE
jgi:hypothetical protein